VAIKVIDASALAALLFSEPDAEAVVAAIGADTLAAPKLLPFEIASVCRKKLQTYPEQRAALWAGYDLLDQIAIQLVDPVLRHAIELAEQSRLTVYDAVYVQLALDLDADLVTLDQAVQKAHRALKR
jgi:predicted nucleic acid-binding protein